MKDKTMMLTILALILIGAGAAWGASDTKNVTLSAAVNSSAKLTLATNTISFADADPDTTSSIPATENPVVVTAKVKTGSSANSATLKVLAADDLKNAASDVIPITNVTSTATNTTGAFFQAGPVTWSKAGLGATVGQGNSGSYSGTFSWFLANSWNYPTGNYTATAIYTLTAP